MCACSGPLTASSHQETQCVVETVQHVAEERHQAVVYNVTTTAEEHHRSKVAQLMGETNKAFEEQTRGHAEATDVLKQAAGASREEIASYLSAKQAADIQEARTVIAEYDASRLSERRGKEAVGCPADSASSDPAEPGRAGRKDRHRLRDGCTTRRATSAVVRATL
mgnify:CR=1 FL=1